MDPAAQRQQKKDCRHAHRKDEEDHQCTCDALAEGKTLTALFLSLVARRDCEKPAQDLFEGADQLPYSLHRMPEPVRIADQKIHCRCDEKHYYSVLQWRQQKLHFSPHVEALCDETALCFSLPAANCLHLSTNVPAKAGSDR